MRAHTAKRQALIANGSNCWRWLTAPGGAECGSGTSAGRDADDSAGNAGRLTQEVGYPKHREPGAYPTPGGVTQTHTRKSYSGRPRNFAATRKVGRTLAADSHQ